MKKLTFTFCFIVLLLFVVSCTMRLGDFTVLSTKNVELGAKYEKVGTGEAKDEVFVLYVPLGSPNIENAVDKILDEKEGDLLTNTVISFYNYSFLIGVMGYKVKGDVWKRVITSNIDKTKDYYELVQYNGELFLVSCKEPNKMFKAYERHDTKQ